MSSFRPALEEAVLVRAGFSTRLGGVSRPPFNSLNLGLSTSDDPTAVDQNRGRMMEAAGLGEAGMAIAGQVHGAAVRHVVAPGLYPGVDGLVTDVPGVALCITAADCAAVLFVDPEARVIGACHAGWRGAVAGVVENTLQGMKARGAAVQELLAYVSPCISAERFEVGEEVARLFPEGVVQRGPGPRPHVDLKAAILTRLVEAGVAPGRVEVDPDCTAGQTDRYFSYRAESGATGRMMGVIGLTP